MGKKKLLSLLLIIIFVSTLFGCSSAEDNSLFILSEIEEKEVDVKILLTAQSIQQHLVYVEYDGKKLFIDDQDSYNFCKDKESHIVKANIKIIKYESGIREHSLTSIKRDL